MGVFPLHGGGWGMPGLFKIQIVLVDAVVGGDAHTTAGLETGATKKRSINGAQSESVPPSSDRDYDGCAPKKR